MATPLASIVLDIPDDLVIAVKERRVIPFIGAGFSSSLGMPNWETLLKNLAEEIDEVLSFDQIKEMTDEDFLQIAEYLFIKSDRRIGPLRHVIEGLVGNDLDPVLSACHVELVNLGAPQIYTTNYDDLLERTYKNLKIPAAKVALPKDVAYLNNDKTQIVKYHGDLRHEGTLVLTESAYYRRLDLESPMDIKFRSDILGRSVLFMGYSFRDVNIRLIWFKLMQMMQDIPTEDRPTSYIVKIGPNPVQDTLFRDVGLKPITLDPLGKYSDIEPSKLLSEFLSRLATRAGESTIPGTSEPMFVSTSLLESLPVLDEARDQSMRASRISPRNASNSPRRFIERRLPTSLKEEGPTAFRSIMASGQMTEYMLPNLGEKIKLFGASRELTQGICTALRGRFIDSRVREVLTSTLPLPWEIIWGSKISPSFAKEIIEGLQSEYQWSKAGHADFDIAFAADLVKRIVLGLAEDDAELLALANRALERAGEIYPSILEYEVDVAGPPKVGVILAQISDREKSLAGEVDPGRARGSD